MRDNYISIIKAGETFKVKVSDIVMVERKYRKLHLVTDDRDYEYYDRIENVSGKLDERFYPCLKGCYINMDKVVSMSEQTITFENGEKFCLGRENFIRTRQTYSRYLQKNSENLF